MSGLTEGVASQRDALSNLRVHASRASSNRQIAATEADELEHYANRLTRSLQSLQNQIRQSERALEQLRAKATSISLDEPSEDPRKRLQQVRTISTAYKSLIPAEPTLPSPESPLPALLALRSTLNIIHQSKETIRDTSTELEKAKVKLRYEGKNLDDASYLTSALERRIQKLQSQQEEISTQNVQDVAKMLITEQQQRKVHYAKELRELVRSFNKFVNEQLAIMLAAEDLGGPTVGDDLELDDDVLKAGFTQLGKARKLVSESQKTEEMRGRRNQETWAEFEHDGDAGPKGEREAAAASLRNLTENLLNAMAGQGQSSPYIKIAQENAAVRFLVRAKVAEMHPNDAQRIRLLDFGAQLED